LAGFTGVLPYLIRMYVVAKVSKILLTGCDHVKAHMQENLQEKTKSTNSPENL
jgi:hypothetical protein